MDFSGAFSMFPASPDQEALRQALMARVMAAQGGSTAVPMQPMAPQAGNMLAPPTGAVASMERGSPFAPPAPQGFVPPGGNALSAVATNDAPLPQSNNALMQAYDRPGAPMDLAAMTQPATPGAPMDLGAVQKADRPATSWLTPERAEFLTNMFAGWAMGKDAADSLGKGAMLGIAGRKEGAARTKAEQQQNQTLAWLKSKGLDDQSASMLASSPAALQDYMKNSFGGASGRKTTEINGRLVDAQTGEVIADYSPQATGERANRGLQPIFGQDAQGNPVILQLGSDGEAVQAALPEGVSIRRDPMRIDAGTSTVLIDPITRQPIATVPKDVAGAAGQEVTGRTQAEKAAALPNTLAQADMMSSSIDSILNDPAFERGVGLSSVFNAIPGTAGYDFSQKVQQLQGQAFLQAFNSLKGGGAITEIEGQKAEAAIARLSTSQSEDAFRGALQELKTVIELGKQRARKMAGETAETPVQPGGGSSGYKILGVE